MDDDRLFAVRFLTISFIIIAVCIIGIYLEGGFTPYFFIVLLVFFIIMAIDIDLIFN